MTVSRETSPLICKHDDWTSFHRDEEGRTFAECARCGDPVPALVSWRIECAISKAVDDLVEVREWTVMRGKIERLLLRPVV